MKKTTRNLIPVTMALVLALTLPLVFSPPVAKATLLNIVNVDFQKHYVHHTDGSNVFADGLVPAQDIGSSSGIFNEPDGSTESVNSPTVNFTADSGVGVIHHSPDANIVGSSYTWDLDPIIPNHGDNREVHIDPAGLEFVPGFNAELVYTRIGGGDPHVYTESGQLELVINVAPNTSMDGLSMVVDVPFDFVVDAHISSITTSGDYWLAPDGKHLDIHFPYAASYSETVIIDVNLPSGMEGIFKPEVSVTSWSQTSGSTTGLTVGAYLASLGTWTWTASDTCSWNFWEGVGRTVYFPGLHTAVNVVHASFEAGQSLNVTSDVEVLDVVLPANAATWINTDLHNEPDETGEPIFGPAPGGVDGPLVSLYADPWPIHLEPQDLLIEPGESWGFPPIPQWQGQRAEGWYGWQPFEPGFSATRSANHVEFTPAGGSQVVTVEVTPTDPIQRLAVHGGAHISDYINSHITNIDTYFPVETNWQGGWDPNGLMYEVFEPITGETYVWEITIEIDPLDEPYADFEYLPFIQVRNMYSITNGEEYGDSLTGMHPFNGSWTWLTSGNYYWIWENRQFKEVNFEGLATIFYEAEDLVTETRFHLSNGGLRLYDGAVVPEASEWIRGNLFTFSLFGSPREAEITSWSYEIEPSGSPKHPNKLEIFGSFTINVVDMWYDFGPINGTIEVAFEGECYSVEDPFGSEEVLLYNFEADFEIVSGTDFYAGLGGSGTIAGTLHNYPWDPGHPEYSNPELQKWFDFVLIGEAEFD